MIIGIDPGLSGAIAFLCRVNKAIALHVVDMPVVHKEICLHGLSALIREKVIEFAVLEHAQGMPGQQGMFNYGRGFGRIETVLFMMGIQCNLVKPQKWKKTFSLTADKDRVRAAAMQLFPNYAELFARKKDDGRAEAALMALYGAQVLTRKDPAI